MPQAVIFKFDNLNSNKILLITSAPSIFSFAEIDKLSSPLYKDFVDKMHQFLQTLRQAKFLLGLGLPYF